MALKKITPLPGAALRIEMENRGWKVRMLSERWAFSSRRRVEQILKDDKRPLYLDDAFKGLPQFVGDPTVEVQPLAPSQPSDFLGAFIKKGWTVILLSERWGLTRRRIDQIVADLDRPRYYDDAIAGLPIIEERVPRAFDGSATNLSYGDD